MAKYRRRNVGGHLTSVERNTVVARYRLAREKFLKAKSVLEERVGKRDVRQDRNKPHPDRPQEKLKLPHTHARLKREIQEASRRAKRAEHEYLSLRRQYRELQEQLGGPSTVEMIVVKARYRQARRERSAARSHLRTLLGTGKARESRR